MNGVLHESAFPEITLAVPELLSLGGPAGRDHADLTRARQVGDFCLFIAQV
jgi:hypothetical protein